MKLQRTHTLRGAVNARPPLPAALSDEQLKARALQRWENDGGRIARRLDEPKDGLKKGTR